MIKNVLFDLDGTLLPMPSQDGFIGTYFKALGKKLFTMGYDHEKIIKAIWMGTEAMVKNNGEKSNEQRFWDCFSNYTNIELKEMEPILVDFYENEFDLAKETTGINQISNRIIKSLKSKGYNVVLATNPIFPKVATKKRIKWAEMDFDDFSLVTTYENSCFSKPNPKYYADIIERLGFKPEETLMVGNDVGEDMISKSINLDVFLVTDNLIDKHNEACLYPRGSLEDFYNKVLELPRII